MTDNIAKLFKNSGDIFDGVDPAAAKKQNFLHVDMDEVAAGVNVVSFIWLRLLQLRRMRPKDKYLLLSNQWLSQYGIGRRAKNRGLLTLRERGLIRTARTNAGNTRVAIIPRNKRRVAGQKRRDR